MCHIGRNGTERRPVDGGAKLCRGSCRADDLFEGGAIADGNHLDFARLIFHVPRQMQVGGGGEVLAWVVGCPAGVDAPSWELRGFLAVGLPVDEQLYFCAVGVAGHLHDLSLVAFPVPVWQQVEDGLIAPDALEKPIAVLLEAAVVEIARLAATRRPPRLTIIVDACPHEVADDVVVGRCEAPAMLHVNQSATDDAVLNTSETALRLLLLRAEAVGSRTELWRGCCARPLVLSAWATQSTRLRSYHAAVGVVGFVDSIEHFATGAPAVGIVIADDVVLKGCEEFWRGRAVRGNLVVAAGHQPRVVELVAEGNHLGGSTRAFCRALVANLVADAPHHHRRMVAVARHHCREVALVPLAIVEVVVLLVLPINPLVEGFIHHEEAHAVAEVEELRCRWVVSGADGVAVAAFQNLQPSLPHPFGHCSAYGTPVVMQVHTFHLHLLAVQQESFVERVFDGADAERVLYNVDDALVVEECGAQRVEIRIL